MFNAIGDKYFTIGLGVKILDLLASEGADQGDALVALGIAKAALPVSRLPFISPGKVPSAGDSVNQDELG